jgi:putative ABC transport system permease protein
VAWEVVGFGGDVQVTALDADAPPTIYLSHLQSAENRMAIVVRTEVGTRIANDVRRLVKAMDPGIPVYGAATISRKLHESSAVFSRRFPMILCILSASFALTLTLIALYAICTHEVQSRHREFGIRVALGSSPGAIRRLVWGDALLVGVAGVVTGSLAAVALSRSLRALLFGVGASDWRVYAAVAAGVLASALLVTIAPALRAGSVKASVVMRSE